MSRMITVAVMAAVALLLPIEGALAGSATYCVSGSSTGIGWTFFLECEGGGTSVGGGNIVDGAIPAGAPCSVLAQQFVDSTNVTGLGWTATLGPGDCCFTVSNPDCTDQNIRLSVQTAGTPLCTVTPTNPCTFNPTITQVGPVAVEPNTWGRVKSRYR